MKENNLQKKPSSAREYANLFLLDENGKKRDFSNSKNIYLITIGYAETLWILLQEFAGKNITIIDRKSEIDYIETLIKIHKRNDIRIIRKEVETDEAVLSAILDLNMNMFDLIIANPPYGKRGTLATTLIKEFMKFAEECIVLCQPRSIEKNGVYEHVVKADIVDNIFDAGLGKLAVSKIRNGYTEGKQVLYGKREIQETDITFQVRKFNDSRLDRVAIMYSRCSINPVKYRDLVASGKLFLFGVFDMGHVVQDPNKTHGLSVDLNFYRRDLQWASEVHRYGNDCYAFEFSSKKAKENFRDVFFDIPKVGFWSKLIEQAEEYSKGMPKAESYVPAIDWEHLDESPLWQTSKEKAFLVELIKEGGQKIVLAYLKTKNENLDWSHPWTDGGILRELGLPEDFLEMEKENDK